MNPATPMIGKAVAWECKSVEILFTTPSILILIVWRKVLAWWLATSQFTVMVLWYSRYASRVSIRPIPIITILIILRQSHPNVKPMNPPAIIGVPVEIKAWSTTVSNHLYGSPSSPSHPKLQKWWKGPNLLSFSLLFYGSWPTPNT